jgi:hypothetical protein
VKQCRDMKEEGRARPFVKNAQVGIDRCKWPLLRIPFIAPQRKT